MKLLIYGFLPPPFTSSRPSRASRVVDTSEGGNRVSRSTRSLHTLRTPKRPPTSPSFEQGIVLTFVDVDSSRCPTPSGSRTPSGDGEGGILGSPVYGGGSQPGSDKDWRSGTMTHSDRWGSGRDRDSTTSS